MPQTWKTLLVLLHVVLHCLACVNDLLLCLEIDFVSQNDMNTDFNAVDKECLQIKENDDSHRVYFTETFPLIRDTDGSCIAECISGDCCAEVKQENVAPAKQELYDVCCVLYPMSLFSLLHQKEFVIHGILY